MNPNFKTITDIAPRIEPEMWRACNPRIYKNADNFGNPQVAGAVLASSILTIRDHGHEVAQTQNVIYLAAAQILKYDIPTFFVQKELAEAALRTSPPDNYKWTEMPMPFEGGVFVLPKGLVHHPRKGEVDIIGFGRTRAGLHTVALKDCPTVRTANDNFIIFTGLRESAGFEIYDRTFNSKTNPTIAEVYNQKSDKSLEAYDKMFHLPFESGDTEFMHLLCKIVFNLLLAAATRPELIEAGAKVGRHKKSGAEIWTPRFLGRKYRVQAKGESVSLGGHIRWHWRSGHFRLQHFGQGRTEEKLIWIEPYQAGGKL